MDTNTVKLSQSTIDALNEELAYQNCMSNTTRADGNANGVAGQLVVLSSLTQQANHAWMYTAGDEAALELIRKIAATAIRALELHGCPRRVPKCE